MRSLQVRTTTGASKHGLTQKQYRFLSIAQLTMPFEFFPGTRRVDGEKRKRGDDDTRSQKNFEVDGGEEGKTATDEEVEEFFAIMRRLHAATKYIEKIDGAGRLLMGKRLKPSLEMKACEEEADQDKIGGDKTPEHKMERSLGLDLNSEPACVESDAHGRRSGSQHPKPPSRTSAASPK